jgi:hypothetical protein
MCVFQCNKLEQILVCISDLAVAEFDNVYLRLNNQINK